MIGFSTLQGLTIPEGVVTKIERDGTILWELQTSKPVVLEVAKVTSNTYAGETLYENEQFILLDIYPKTNGTVKVTYGGLTKTITDTSGAEQPNAQQVYFGTFNGVSDTVTTPASGELVIEGEYENFGCGNYQQTSKGGSINNCGCITGVTEWGSITSIVAVAFAGCVNLTVLTIPDGITSIGHNAFSNCSNLAISSLPSSIVSIGNFAFVSCGSLNFNDNFFKSGLVSIGSGAFDLDQCDDSLAFSYESITIPETVTTIGEDAFGGPIIGSHSHPYLKRVIVLPTTPPTGMGTIIPCFGEADVNYPIKIVVPKGCGATYKVAEGWSLYADYIVEAS